MSRVLGRFYLYWWYGLVKKRIGVAFHLLFGGFVRKNVTIFATNTRHVIFSSITWLNRGTIFHITWWRHICVAAMTWWRHLYILYRMRGDAWWRRSFGRGQLFAKWFLEYLIHLPVSVRQWRSLRSHVVLSKSDWIPIVSEVFGSPVRAKTWEKPRTKWRGRVPLLWRKQPWLRIRWKTRIKSWFLSMW